MAIQAENSEVFLAASVAVAVTTQPGDTDTGRLAVKLDEQVEPKVTLVWPR